MRSWALGLALCAIFVRLAGADPADEKSREQSLTLAVEVIDGDGRAVEGAEVGLCAAVGEWARKQAEKDGTQWHYWQHARTDSAGRANLQDYEKFLRGCALLARHEERKISGCIAVDAGASQQPVRLILQPEIEVTAELHCEALASRGIKYLPAGVAVDLGRPRVLVVSSNSGRVRFSLPPGEYQLQIDTYLHRAEITKRPLTISAQKGFRATKTESTFWKRRLLRSEMHLAAAQKSQFESRRSYCPLSNVRPSVLSIALRRASGTGCGLPDA
jgi:hypothetical protein